MINKLKTINFSNIIFGVYIVFIIAFSIYARTKVLLYDFPFFDDEIDLLNNVLKRDYLHLFLPLDEAKIGPPLFLMVGRFIYLRYGLNELILRLSPYIASILSVIGFLYLSLIVLKKKISVLFANFVFAVHEYLLIYTYSFKQYSYDILTTIIILIAVIKLKDFKLKNWQLVLLSIIASVLVWASYTAGFVIVTSFTALCVYKYVKKNEKYKQENNTTKLYKPTIADCKKFFPFVIPFTSLMLLYFFVTCLPSHNDYLNIAWKRIYAYDEFFYPKNITDFEHFFHYLLGIRNFNPWITCFWFLCSSFLLFKNNKILFILLVIPFILGAIMGVLELYPFAAERVSLYLSPMFFIILAYITDIICIGKTSKIIVFILFNTLIFNHDYKMVFNPMEHIMYSDRLHKYFVNMLYQSDLTNNDYIYVKGNDKKVLRIYDTKKILDNTKIVIPVFDEGIYYNTKKTLNNIPKGANIYFNTANKVDSSDMCTDEVEWIKDNCEIIYSIDAYYGDFIKCKKIK